MAYPSASVTQSGINFATFQKDGFAGLLEALITANLAGTADPTVAPTLAASGTGNTLPAATYWIKVTETNAFGETKPIAAAASQAVTLGQALVVTFQTLKTGNTARNVYASTTSANAGFTLAASGITAGTYSITAPLPTNSYAVAPPTVNSTGLTFVDASGATTNKPLELLRHVEKDNGRALFRYFSTQLRNFNRGDAMPFNAAMTKMGHIRGVLALLLQAANESGTLMDANAGTIGAGAVIGNTFPPQRRTWP